VRKSWGFLGIVFVIALATATVYFQGSQPDFDINETAAMKARSSLILIRNYFPKKAEEIDIIIERSAKLEQELKRQNHFLRFLFGAPTTLINQMAQGYNETEEKLADIFSLSSKTDNPQGVQDEIKVVRNKMFVVWERAQKFSKYKGLFGF